MVKTFVTLTLDQFRKRNGLSKNAFKRLRMEGRGPRIIDISGGRITLAAEAEWQRAMEQEASATVVLRKKRA